MNLSDKYRLEARLGGGGMAEVFVGQAVGAEGFQRRVAIKRILPGYSDNEAFAKMFVAEAQITARLQHPNIVSVVDFDRDAEQRLFLVMELVEGKDLGTLAATGLLPVPAIVYVIVEVLRGLGHAHDLPVGAGVRGVVHRDVSPHNVLLGWEGSVKVSDFGIAKARDASAASASELLKGKPSYMSPEQANGLPLDGRSDLFAVGVILWEMLVGRRLFVGDDTKTTLGSVLFGAIPRPRTQRADVPADVERVCMKLLARDLPQRYATADEAIADLLDGDAAPKNGRALLAQLLAQRYPHDAPLRHSQLRGRAGASAPPPAAEVVAPFAPTLPMETPPRALPVVSIGVAMAAPTGVLPSPPDAETRVASKHGRTRRVRGQGWKIAVVIAVTVLSAAGAFALVSALQ